MSYHQLTQEQRYQIYALKKTGHSGSEIADVIGVHKSSVSRELRRHRGGRGYRPQPAHQLALERRSKADPRICAKTWATVEKLLRQEWSPEQISGRLKQEQKICISHEWITNMFGRIKVQAVICTSICVAKSNRESGMEHTIGGANCSIVAGLKSVLPWSITESAWATGKWIPCSEEITNKP
jgi:IS30 family transposase